MINKPEARYESSKGVLVLHPEPVCQHGYRLAEECEACNDLWLIWSAGSDLFKKEIQ